MSLMDVTEATNYLAGVDPQALASEDFPQVAAALQALEVARPDNYVSVRDRLAGVNVGLDRYLLGRRLLLNSAARLAAGQGSGEIEVWIAEANRKNLTQILSLVQEDPSEEFHHHLRELSEGRSVPLIELRKIISALDSIYYDEESSGYLNTNLELALEVLTQARDLALAKQAAVTRLGDAGRSDLIPHVHRLALGTLGAALLKYGSLNWEMTDLLFDPDAVAAAEADRQSFDSFLFTQAPSALATRERFGIFREVYRFLIDNGLVQAGATWASIPGGRARDLIEADLSRAEPRMIVALDKDPDAVRAADDLARARERNLFFAFKNDALTMNVVNQYDVVTSNGLNIYLDDEQVGQFNRNLFNAVRPGGYVVLSHLTPRDEWDEAGLDLNAVGLQQVLFGQVAQAKWVPHARSIQTVVAQLEAAGFEVVEINAGTWNIFPTFVAYKPIGGRIPVSILPQLEEIATSGELLKHYRNYPEVDEAPLVTTTEHSLDALTQVPERVPARPASTVRDAAAQIRQARPTDVAVTASDPRIPYAGDDPLADQQASDREDEGLTYLLAASLRQTTLQTRVDALLTRLEEAGVTNTSITGPLALAGMQGSIAPEQIDEITEALEGGASPEALSQLVCSTLGIDTEELSRDAGSGLVAEDIVVDPSAAISAGAFSVENIGLVKG